MGHICCSIWQPWPACADEQGCSSFFLINPATRLFRPENVAQGTGPVLVNIMIYHSGDDMISVGLISQVNVEFKLHTVEALHPNLS